MQQGTASRTAEGAAAARAMHTLLVDDPVFEDPFAIQLTSPGWRRAITTPLLNFVVKKLLLKSLRSTQAQVVVRSRYAEELLQQAIAAGVTQYAIVGAGFDSFCLRRRDLESTVQVFEFDHADTQRAKLERLQSLGQKLPKNLRCIPIDFEQETIADAILKSDYRADRPGFFSWLGTTPYLSTDATLATLRAIAQTAAPGTEIVFDYLIPTAQVPASERASMRRLKRFTERRGEPLIGEFEPSTMAALLTAAGFQMLENLSPAEQTQRFFRERTDGLVPLAAAYLVHARVHIQSSQGKQQ